MDANERAAESYDKLMSALIETIPLDPHDARIETLAKAISELIAAYINLADHRN